jgi:hypothetical protein
VPRVEDLFVEGDRQLDGSISLLDRQHSDSIGLDGFGTSESVLISMIS